MPTHSGRRRTIAALLALTACALLPAPLSAPAQEAPEDPAAHVQDVEMPREVRVLVQRGLAFLGFDPGPADGLFGPKTRAAIWDWQTAKELDTTGYLTLPEVETLATMGAEASETLEVQMDEPAARESADTEAEDAAAPSGSDNQVLYFPTCGTDDARPDGCWAALSVPAECVMWWPEHWFDTLDRVVASTWSGECDESSRVTGRGTLTQRLTSKRDDGSVDFLEDRSSGAFVEGKRHGKWTWYDEDRHTIEGAFVGGLEQGHWVVRFPDDGCALEGPFVNGLMHGQWRLDCDSGDPDVYEYRHGEKLER